MQTDTSVAPATSAQSSYDAVTAVIVFRRFPAQLFASLVPSAYSVFPQFLRHSSSPDPAYLTRLPSLPFLLRAPRPSGLILPAGHRAAAGTVALRPASATSAPTRPTRLRARAFRGAEMKRPGQPAAPLSRPATQAPGAPQSDPGSCSPGARERRGAAPGGQARAPLPARPPPHHALGARRQAPRGRGRGGPSQQPGGHGSAVGAGSRTERTRSRRGPFPRPARLGDVRRGCPRGACRAFRAREERGQRLPQAAGSPESPGRRRT